MKKKKLMSQSRESYQIQDSGTEPGTILMHAGTDEMIKITPNGFWVRGDKVVQDDKEAQVVYDAFKEWLVWSSLSREY
jgi:hypothetical protein